MKAFLTGLGGQRVCDTKYLYVKLDITDVKAVDKAISEIKSDIVIRCAAWQDALARYLKEIR